MLHHSLQHVAPCAVIFIIVSRKDSRVVSDFARGNVGIFFNAYKKASHSENPLVKDLRLVLITGQLGKNNTKAQNRIYHEQIMKDEE